MTGVNNRTHQYNDPRSTNELLPVDLLLMVVLVVFGARARARASASSAWCLVLVLVLVLVLEMLLVVVGRLAGLIVYLLSSIHSTDTKLKTRKEALGARQLSTIHF